MEEDPRDQHMRGIHQEKETVGTSDDMVRTKVNDHRIVRTIAVRGNIAVGGKQMKGDPHGVQSTVVASVQESDRPQGPGPTRAPLRLHPVDTTKAQSVIKDVAPPEGDQEAHHHVTKEAKSGAHHEQE